MVYPGPVETVTGDDPATHAFAITPSDSTTFTHACRGIYVGGGGDVKLDTYGGETGILFAAVPTGQILPVTAIRVYGTGTTATFLVGLW